MSFLLFTVHLIDFANFAAVENALGMVINAVTYIVYRLDDVFGHEGGLNSKSLQELTCFSSALGREGLVSLYN